jgi:hypothetical protein
MRPDKKIIATRTRTPSHQGGHGRRPLEDPGSLDARFDGTEGFRAPGNSQSMEEAEPAFVAFGLGMEQIPESTLNVLFMRRFES